MVKNCKPFYASALHFDTEELDDGDEKDQRHSFNLKKSKYTNLFLEARGIYTSKSSACKKGGRSHVLEAIGLPANVIDGALRISFSRYTTREDIDALCDALRDAKQSLFPSLH